jgi:dolichol-phosphate mannosyltransferase
VAERSSPSPPAISLVIPAYNEQDCIASVIEEALLVLGGMRIPFEVLAVDDGSVDRTAAILAELRQRHPELRVYSLAPNAGQSAAFGVGIRHSRGGVIVLMDGDGQNDPTDIPMLVEALASCDLCCGYRAVRRDSLSKRLGSRLANAVRNWVLHDGVLDTGCSLRAGKAEFLRDLPLYLSGMHRFIPALALMRGAKMKQVPVHHRQRIAGRSKYTNLGRLGATLRDLLAVRWMQSRHRRFMVVET